MNPDSLPKLFEDQLSMCAEFKQTDNQEKLEKAWKLLSERARELSPAKPALPGVIQPVPLCAVWWANRGFFLPEEFRGIHP